MKTYNLEVYDANQTVLMRLKAEANVTEGAHSLAAAKAFGRGFSNFSIRDVSDEEAAQWPEPENTPVSETIGTDPVDQPEEPQNNEGDRGENTGAQATQTESGPSVDAEDNAGTVEAQTGEEKQAAA